MLCSTAIAVGAEHAGSSEENPILISSLAEFVTFADDVIADECCGEGRYWKLSADIDFKGVEWSRVIGSVENPFKGNFDGDGYVIRNYKVAIGDKGAAGLFRYVGGNAVIKNLGIENFHGALTNWSYGGVAGAITAYLTGNAKIESCYVKNVKYTDSVNWAPDLGEFAEAGGLVGIADGSGVVIKDCYALGYEEEKHESGQACSAEGGLVSLLRNFNKISNCYTDSTLAHYAKDGSTPLVVGSVENSYCLTHDWYGENGDKTAVGVLVTEDELKEIAETLGDAYVADLKTAPINNGFPVLVWQVGEVFLPGDANIISTTMADGSTGVSIYGASAELKFDKMISTEKMDDNALVIDSYDTDVKYRISYTEVEYVDTVTVTFGSLKPETEYTFSFADKVQTYAGDVILGSITFKTGKVFGNLLPEGDMQAEDTMSCFSDTLNNSYISVMADESINGKGNKALRFTPAWADHPVRALNTGLEPGKYYMSAWVKSDEAQSIKLSFWLGGDNWIAHRNDVPANVWTFISGEFVVNEGQRPQEISVRADSAAGNYKPFFVDDWSIYSISMAPTNELTVESSSVADGAEEVSPLELNCDIKFNVPVKQSTLLDGVSLKKNGKTDNKIKAIKFDTKNPDKCTVEFERLEADQDYTIDLSGVTSMAGKTITDGEIDFSTVKVNGRAAKVVSTTPADKTGSIKRDNLKIEIVFDSPIEPDTLKNITVSPSISAEYVRDSISLSKCGLSFDKSKLELGKTYTVTVPSTVKTLDEYAVESYSFTFTIVSEKEIVNEIKSADGDEELIKDAVSEVYIDLAGGSYAYEYVLANYPDKEDALYKKLAVNVDVESIDDICEWLNRNSLEIILENTTDEDIVASIMADENGILDSGMNEIFNEMLGKNAKKKAAKVVIDNKDKSYEAILEEAMIEILDGAFSSVSGPDAVREILKNAEESLTGTDSISSLLKKAEQNSKRSKIYGKLQGLTVTKLSDVKEALKKAIEEVEDDGNGSSGSGGGGSRGGSGGGTGGFVTHSPEIMTEIVEKNEEYFHDLDSVGWAKDSITNLYEIGIVNGKGNGKFMPNDTVVREEFAKIAVLAVNGLDENATVEFTDVERSRWSYSYIASAYKLNLIAGVGDGKFDPAAPITREDMAVILARLAENSGFEITDEEIAFTDKADISDYARTAVAYLSSIGIINGVNDGKFDPKGITTRAQAAVVFDKFLTALGSR